MSARPPASAAGTRTRRRAAAEPARPQRSAYHHGDLPRALIDAATRLIEEDGVEAITLREVARALGVNHAAAYRHFDDKAALLAAIVTRWYRTLGERLRAAAARAPASDTRARLERALGAYVQFALDSPARFRTMFGERINEDGRFPELETAIRESLGVLLEEIAAGQQAGHVRDGRPTDLALGLWVAAHGYADMLLRRRIKARPKLAVAYLATLLAPAFDGLLVPPARR